MSARGTRLAWGMLVLPLWAVLVLCTYWEPVLRDGWNELDLLRGPVTPRLFWDVAIADYLVMNPRLGQLATLVPYAFESLHPVITPLVELGLLALLTALALGRWPSVRRADDAFVALVVTALVLACTPQIGPMLFYRPFTGNYLFGLAVQLGWLVPYRLAAAAPWPPRRWLVPLWLVVGFAAGMCNEHTGLALLAMAAVGSIAVVRRDGAAGLPWLVAGLVGFAAGYVVLLTAPAQHLRYDGIAEQAGYLQRIVDRGLDGNVWVVSRLARAMLPALPVVVAAVIERWWRGPIVRPGGARWAAVALAAGGVLCTLTLLASPKIGPRLYGASVALIAAAIAGGLAGPLRTAWTRRICGALAAATVAYVAVVFLMIYSAVGPVGRQRREAIEHGAGTVVTLPVLPYAGDRYWLGDDMLVDSVRESVAYNYRIKAIVLVPSRSNPQ